jgi:SAM-dependent methyltransferase
MSPVNAHPAELAPSAWVKRFLPLIPAGGRVLDLAAGGGRHTRLLRQKGHAVVAVDRDATALRARFAEDRACTIVELDLEDGQPWRLGGGFDAVVVTNYLHRPLLPMLADALGAGGALIYETFMAGNERFRKPSNPDFLLQPGELLAVFGGALTILAFEQGIVSAPRPAAIQRLAAVKGELARLPI